MIEIRAAAPDDVDALCAAHLEAWRAGYRDVFTDELLDSTAFAESRQVQWASAWWLGDARQAMFAGVLGGRVLGFANVGSERINGVAREFGRGEVYAFYVHPQAWGTGLATALMDAGQGWLRERGHAHAVLWVLRDNPRARSFYRKTGWAWTGEETTWSGPQLPGLANPEPVAEVQYGRRL